MLRLLAAILVASVACASGDTLGSKTLTVRPTTEADAGQFVDALEARGHNVAGTGLIETFCLD